MSTVKDKLHVILICTVNKKETMYYDLRLIRLHQNCETKVWKLANHYFNILLISKVIKSYGIFLQIRTRNRKLGKL